MNGVGALTIPFPPAQAAAPSIGAVSLADQVRCGEREIKYRRRVYVRLVDNGRMKPETASREIAAMHGVLATLLALPGAPRPAPMQPDLIPPFA